MSGKITADDFREALYDQAPAVLVAAFYEALVAENECPETRAIIARAIMGLGRHLDSGCPCCRQRATG